MPPLNLMIKPVSGHCDMRCKYCFYADVSKNRATRFYQKMSLETLETLVRRALAYAEGSCDFAFQGGEPTLAGIDFYRALVAFQEKYNTRGLEIHNSIQTNGFHMTEELAEFFASRGFLVGVSLDGAKASHDLMRLDENGRGTYDRVLAGIKTLKEAGADVNILCVVNRYVAETPEETFAALKDFSYIQYIACLDDFGGAQTEHSLTPEAYGRFLVKSLELYERAFFAGQYVSIRNFDNYVGILLGRRPENCAMCGQCGVYYLIEGDGGVYPCDFYVIDPYRMGNINDQSFFKLEKSPVAAAFRAASAYVSEPCKACKYFYLCRGGCRRDREPFEAGRPALNHWCEGYKTFFEAAEPRLSKIARAVRAK